MTKNFVVFNQPNDQTIQGFTNQKITDFNLIPLDFAYCQTKQFYQTIEMIYDQSYNDIVQYSKLDLGYVHQRIFKTKIVDLVVQKFNYFAYQNLSSIPSEPNSVFDLFVGIFGSVSMGHILPNGNKRMSFLIMMRIMRLMGYHLMIDSVSITSSITSLFDQYSRDHDQQHFQSTFKNHLMSGGEH